MLAILFRPNCLSHFPYVPHICVSESSFFQVVACRLFGAKPLPKPMIAYCQLNSWGQILVKFESEFCHFHSRKFSWKCRLPKWWPFCTGGDELIQLHPAYENPYRPNHHHRSANPYSNFRSFASHSSYMITLTYTNSFHQMFLYVTRIYCDKFNRTLCII